MLVKITTPILGIEAGRIVGVSNERGMAWIQRGFAVAAKAGEQETPPAEKKKTKEAPSTGKKK